MESENCEANRTVWENIHQSNCSVTFLHRIFQPRLRVNLNIHTVRDVQQTVTLKVRWLQWVLAHGFLHPVLLLCFSEATLVCASCPYFFFFFFFFSMMGCTAMLNSDSYRSVISSHSFKFFLPGSHTFPSSPAFFFARFLFSWCCLM